jgi:acyl-CoA reductase-like NAD-dependent aldehyde dehydrogenase
MSTPLKDFPSHYINGQWVAAASGPKLEVHQSSTGQVMARIPEGTVAEADAAVRAASAAFDDWSQTPVEERAAYLDKIATGLKARKDELAQTIAREVGMPAKLAGAVQVGGPIAHWGNFAKVARSFAWQEQVGNSLVVREPVGVVAAITPWNFPLSQITLKVAAALAAGCTVVLKPSEVAPVNAFILAEVIHDSGLPAGVFNLVTGLGPVVGEAMAAHPLVDMVSFTGSTRAGRRVGAVAAETVKRVALELGGKSASVILPDADLEAAVKGTVNNCFLNSGQTCSATTRMLVPEARYEEAKAFAKATAERFSVGDPLAEGTKLGPLVSQMQQDKVLGLIATALKEGAELVTGSAEKPKLDGDLAGGYFVTPTVLGRVKTTDTVGQEEIFGPVLSIITYADEAEAVKIANDSIYGLGGAVWAGSDERAIAVARRIRTGQVDINGGPFNLNAPFGGFKQSGNGRENGVYGLEEFLEFKSLQLKPAPVSGA